MAPRNEVPRDRIPDSVRESARTQIEQMQATASKLLEQLDPTGEHAETRQAHEALEKFVGHASTLVEKAS